MSIASLVNKDTKYTKQQGRLTRDDLAVAVVSDKGHEDYVHFSRAWRQVLHYIKFYLARCSLTVFPGPLKQL